MMKILNSEKGFTFIELIIVFSITAILSTVGLASFVDYNRRQTLNTSVYDLVTLLNQAKSRAQSQMIRNQDGNNMCGNQSFNGYKILICGLAGSTCIANQKDYYELDIVCSGSIENSSNPIEAKKLPSNVTFDEKTTTTSIFFKSFVGGVEGAGTVVINAFQNLKRDVSVDSYGNTTMR